ncbi:LacI family transcriptional regulator [Achromobacter sp. HZ01]|uniref:Bug family tripartite tricarboxylate transporter substrate binding protein n=1 Tax=Achromobacter sp. HZ01 TaxID=1416886 RepID=UPI000DC20907|nr:tripartite tricarboxylate transporter substrate binding protein [Achromobacter sp. HZ01]RAP62098.1 LacI family transcriptional regulator [Achromobacter sp. HZ01]
MRRRLLRAFGAFALASVAAAAGSAAVAADAFPSKPIRFVVPAAAGGPTEIVTRLLAERMTQSMGVSVIVEAKPGAGGNIGADAVAKAAPDGYTILMGTIGTNAINQTLYKSMPFQPQKDFVAVTQVVSYPLVVVVNPNLPVRSVADLIAYAKANPGKLNRASGGSGTSMHMSGELFNEMAGVKMQHIPYKGSLPALTDVIGGQADLAFDSLVIAQPLIKSGKLRAIAVTGPERSPAAPDLPTVAETLPGYAMTSWIGVFAPAGTPRPVVNRLQQEIAKALADPRVREQLKSQAAEPVASTPDEFARFTAEETKKWAPVVKASGASVS